MAINVVCFTPNTEALRMKLTYDPKKRAKNLEKHGLDFEDCTEVFAGPTYDEPDERQDYGEPRIITAGFLRERMVVVAWTPRDGGRRIISMRKTNDGEKARFGQRFKKG
jgi:uncharacterized protein